MTINDIVYKTARYHKTDRASSGADKFYRQSQHNVRFARTVSFSFMLLTAFYGFFGKRIRKKCQTVFCVNCTCYIGVCPESRRDSTADEYCPRHHIHWYSNSTGSRTKPAQIRTLTLWTLVTYDDAVKDNSNST